MNEFKLPKLPKGHKRVTLTEDKFVDVIGCLENFCNRNNFLIERIEVSNARFSSAMPEQLASVTVYGTTEIDGNRFNASVCGDEMIIGDKLTDLANHLRGNIKITIPS